MKKRLIKASVLFAAILLMTGATAKVSSAEILWKFKIPVELNNMPFSVKYVVLEWFILEKDLTALGQGKVFVPINLSEFGNVSLSKVIEIHSADISTPEKAYGLWVNLHLSTDGINSYSPNTDDKNWTNIKDGTKWCTAVALVQINKKIGIFDDKPTMKEPTPPYWKEISKQQTPPTKWPKKTRVYK